MVFLAPRTVIFESSFCGATEVFLGFKFPEATDLVILVLGRVFLGGSIVISKAQLCAAEADALLSGSAGCEVSVNEAVLSALILI